MKEVERRVCCKMGRPRSEAARKAILCAANELLVRDGFGGMTMEAIAAEAGVSKATLYRWWSCKAAVVMEAFLAATPCPPFPDTGYLREDLRRQMRGLIIAFAGQAGRLIASVIAEAQADPDAANAFRCSYLAPRHAAAKAALVRGQTRGEIRPDADLDIAIDALYGPLYFRLVTSHAPLTPEFADTLLSLVLDGLRPNGPQMG